MTNFEWLISDGKPELQAILSWGNWGLSKDTNGVCACNTIPCSNCVFGASEHDTIGCSGLRSEWLRKQHMELQVGDLVKIVSPGSIYTSYVTWVIDNVDDKILLAKWAYEKSLSVRENADYTEHTFKVMAIGKHGTIETNLVYIQDTSFIDECFLISEDGVEKI